MFRWKKTSCDVKSIDNDIDACSYYYYSFNRYFACCFKVDEALGNESIPADSAVATAGVDTDVTDNNTGTVNLSPLIIHGQRCLGQ
jgi:hypothetical protein